MSKMANGLIFLLLFCVSKYSCAEDTVETSQTLQGSTTGLNNTQAGVFVINDPVSLDEATAMRRNKIKEMMKHAWDNYVKYAGGENELWPNSKRGNSKDSFGSARLGASIVGGLDTLYIMGMMDKFQQGRDWIANNLTLENIDAELVASEINVGIIGGLLSCYALTGDVVFRDKAQYIAQKLMLVFNSPTSIPFAIINTKYAYLYLLFSDDNLISLNEWVFNTEGHPLPIKGVSPYYRTFTQTQSTQSLSKTAEILRLLSARTDYF